MKLIVEADQKTIDECKKLFAKGYSNDAEYAIANGKPYEEIPQGEWVYRQEWFEGEKEPRMAWGCNQCGFSIKSVHEKRNFCPNCGAKLKGE